ncbi:hypothetical protein [Streptomyces avermitilis]|uniref:hypothetical protein n=1 Tax=Streptomyces avermitilis TaxID=33903 RepID=UPI0036BDE50D
MTDFEIWWMDERPQLRLKQAESAYLLEDFDCWVAQENSVAAKQWLQRAGERRWDVQSPERVLSGFALVGLLS